MTLLMPRVLMRPFLDPDKPENAEVVNILTSEKILLIGGINLLLVSVRVISAQALMGADRMGIPLVATMLSTWLGVGLGCLLAFYFGYGIVGMSLGLGAGLFLSAVSQGIYWRYASHHIARDANQQQLPQLVSNRASDSVDDQSERASSAPEQRGLPCTH